MSKATSTTRGIDKSRVSRSNPSTEDRPSGQSADIVVTHIAVTPVDTEARRAMIAEVAYGYAEQRGFVPGFELQDWLAAETQVDNR